ncbi:MAG TPA: hypothetical protein VMT56_03515, partial [Candidatus Bathyarchaeia archaeon]|nr:hypothetical protein [Candidatus Bathyarchaeia archaeon]
MLYRIVIIAILSAPAFAKPCEQLASLHIPDVTISAAKVVAAGPWILPNASPNDSTNVPAFCRVVANIWPEVRFELWLPEHWNGKFLA